MIDSTSIIRRDKLVNFFMEPEQNLDKVLNIFIRVNSGGTVLSYSDLLLSIATAQWKHLDARQEIHDLVADLNKVGKGFAFDKDFVLKSGLFLADISNIKFTVTNFNAKNMKALEDNWPTIRKYLLLAARLLSDFGLETDNLSANSVAIPLAYFLMKRGAGDTYRYCGGYS